jgi:hypothetical protein
MAPGAKDTARVPLTIRVPLDEVTTVQRGDRFETALELRVAVLDELGRRSDLPAIPLRLDHRRVPAPGEQALYEADLELRRARQDVVVALFDPATGKLLAARKATAPGQAAAEGAR